MPLTTGTVIEGVIATWEGYVEEGISLPRCLSQFNLLEPETGIRGNMPKKTGNGTGRGKVNKNRYL